MDKFQEIQNRIDMERRLEMYRYNDIPCAWCGTHYWKVPNEKGEVKLKCPKCGKFTKIEMGDRFKIEPY